MSSKYVGIIAGSIVGVGALLFFGGFFSTNSDSVGQSSFDKLGTSVPSFFSPKQATSSIAQSQGNGVGTSGAVTSDKDTTPPRYYSLDYHFFFDVPKGFSFNEIPDEKGTVVLVEGSAGESFQIFVTPFDEPGPLTPERIKKDLPQKVIRNPRAGTLDGVSAIAFTSHDEDTGDVFEIWFIHDGSLFQITTKSDFADGLQNILQTWKFSN